MDFLHSFWVHHSIAEQVHTNELWDRWQLLTVVCCNCDGKTRLWGLGRLWELMFWCTSQGRHRKYSLRSGSFLVIKTICIQTFLKVLLCRIHKYPKNVIVWEVEIAPNTAQSSRSDEGIPACLVVRDFGIVGWTGACCGSRRILVQHEEVQPGTQSSHSGGGGRDWGGNTAQLSDSCEKPQTETVRNLSSIRFSSECHRGRRPVRSPHATWFSAQRRQPRGFEESKAPRRILRSINHVHAYEPYLIEYVCRSHQIASDKARPMDPAFLSATSFHSDASSFNVF